MYKINDLKLIQTKIKIKTKNEKNISLRSQQIQIKQLKLKR